MTPDLQAELRLLSDKAKAGLRDVPASGGYRHVFSFWTFPSFSRSSRWTIYSPWPSAKGTQPLASFTVWRSDLDSEKFRSPVERLKFPKDLAPTIQEEVIHLNDREVEEFERQIGDISVPLYLGQANNFGCDGTRFEFRYDALFYGATLHWWESYPTEWRPFTDTVKSFIAGLERRK